MVIKAKCANYKCKKSFPLSVNQLNRKRWGSDKFFCGRDCVSSAVSNGSLYF